MTACLKDYRPAGMCAEFNTELQKIRTNFFANCKDDSPPCPVSYNSTEAYKYGKCYDMVSTTSSSASTIQLTTVPSADTGTTPLENRTKPPENRTSNTPGEEDANISTTAVVIIIILVIVIITITLVFLWCYKKRKKQSNGKGIENISQDNDSLPLQEKEMMLMKDKSVS
ncbi:uncharacterized protein LOC133195026 [Saccostrea echinata]|uniref:uncharacterized protein LOC133195026 n=1 Tax=Saccostrea echinata TaxID=191078 RepID=UPI002A840C52|nr:uncharacterized protein LOC133195026 [Saccostrea echinata]